MFFTQEDYKKIEEYLKLNSKKDTDFENIGLNSIDKDDIITLIHENKNVKTRLYDLFLSKAYLSLLEEERLALLDKIQELELIILNLKINEIHISDKFGINDYAAPSVSITTNALNRIWQKLEDITGETLQGINMTVTPNYFISELPCPVHITANTVDANGKFEHIAFYANGVLIAEASDVDYFEYDTTINESTVIKCIAKIMGIEYTKQTAVTHYNSFWMGAGTDFHTIMDESHVIPIDNGMKGNYGITFNQGDNLFIIVGESLRGQFERADMNGFEIPFEESTATIDGTTYKVFTSSNKYAAGTYNIDINA